jgi:proline racemase
MTLIRTIDAHAAGAPLRLVVEGFPAAEGDTLEDKRLWLERHADGLRRALLYEPRGHADMVGAVLTPPATPGAHAGCVFMHAGGFAPMCGHGIIAVATVAVERGLIGGATFGGECWRLVLDVPAATLDVVADVRMPDGANAPPRVERVRYSGLPAVVAAPNVDVGDGSRPMRADLVWHGGLYAVLDAEQLGTPLTLGTLPEMRRAARPVLDAVARKATAALPRGAGAPPLEGIVLTTASERADLRLVTIYTDGAVDRSPSGGGTAAALAVLDAMGLATEGEAVRVEGLAGGIFSARIAGRTMVGEKPAILPEIAGTAWITGEHTFVLDPADPFRFGLA